MDVLKNLFFVFGPESSGNHVTSKVLQTMGCFWEEPQRLDKFVSGEVDISDVTTDWNVVLRRSIPHGNDWPDPKIIKQRFIDNGYVMRTIVPVRDWIPNIFSNYYHRELSVDDALDKLRHAWIHLANHIYDIQPFYFFNTSLLFKDPKSAIEGLEYFTDLKWPDVPYEKVIYDADIGKHEVFREHGFKTIDRAEIRKHIRKPKPVIL